MANLRLVGVQEDGEHLILTSEDGANFSLRIDEALRVAASSALVRPESGQPPETFTPRDIQARIRAGATAEQISSVSKLPLEHIHKYEGPVLAERAHVAALAQKVLARHVIADEPSFASLDPQLPAIDKVVDYQLRNNGIDTSDIDWDAWRQNDGSWLIILSFRLTNETTKQQARWSFAASSQKLEPLNPWAKRLASAPTEKQSVPALSGVDEKKKDGTGPAAVSVPPESAPYEPEPAVEATDEPAAYGLLDKLRSRRGQRLGAVEEEDDEIALFLASKGTEAEDGAKDRRDISTHSTVDLSKALETPVTSYAERSTGVTAKVLPFRASPQQYDKKLDDFYTVRIKDSYDKTFLPSVIPPSEDLHPEEGLPSVTPTEDIGRLPGGELFEPPREESGYPPVAPETVSLPQPIVPAGLEGKSSDADGTDSGDTFETATAEAKARTADPSALSRRNKKNRKAAEETSADDPPLPNPISASGRQLSAAGQRRDSFSAVKGSLPYDRDNLAESFGGDAIAERAKKKTARSKRSSVPSWDDIVFGTKGDG